VLFNLNGAEKASIGCMIELGWASAYRKFIITVMTESNIHWHGMVRDLTDLVFPTLAEALDVIPTLVVERDRRTE
jgi:hypothetical protein